MLGGRLQRLIDIEFSGEYEVYYDHKLTNPDKIYAHIGDMCRENNLAELDIAIVSQKDGHRQLVLVAEIEEHKHSPKRFLGDLSSIMLSEHVMVDGQDYPMRNLIILIGLVSKENGVTGKKAKKFVSMFEAMIGEGHGGNRNLRCTVLDSTTGDGLIQEVEKFVMERMASIALTK